MQPRISIITLGVEDLQRSYEFYTELGLASSKTPEDGIIFFKTSGTCLALYPLSALAEDVSEDLKVAKTGFSGITLAHNTQTQIEVDQILAKVASIGGKIVKPAQDVFWGGYSGYFSDPDGYLWEVAYGDCWEFNQDGSLVID